MRLGRLVVSPMMHPRERTAARVPAFATSAFPNRFQNISNAVGRALLAHAYIASSSLPLITYPLRLTSSSYTPSSTHHGRCVDEKSRGCPPAFCGRFQYGPLPNSRCKERGTIRQERCVFPPFASVSPADGTLTRLVSFSPPRRPADAHMGTHSRAVQGSASSHPPRLCPHLVCARTFRGLGRVDKPSNRLRRATRNSSHPRRECNRWSYSGNKRRAGD